MKRFLLAGAAFAALTSASFAADYPVESVDVWSGFYAGAQVGYGWSDSDFTYDTAFTPGVIVSDFEGDGFVGGVLFGRNWQFDNIVLGLDGSFSFADIEGSIDVTGPAYTVDVTLESFTASRVRLGYATDSMLFYIAGGVSLGNINAQTDGAPPANTFDQDSEWTLGWTVGAGVEGFISENWTARLEALYLSYEDVEFDPPAGGDLDLDLDVVVVRAGIAYHF